MLQEDFRQLYTPQSSEELDQEIIDNFILPFNLNQGRPNTSKQMYWDKIKEVTPLITSEDILKLLSDPHWMARRSGTFFVGLRDLTEFEEIIGNLLLKSELTYVGSDYCLTLTEFNSNTSVHYLKRYLDYYLTKKDLWYDQGDAMGALNFLDTINNTNNLEAYMDVWNDFVSNKPNWNLDRSLDVFKSQIEEFKNLKEFVLDEKK